MKYKPYDGPLDSLWDGSEPGWVLVHVNAGLPGEAPRYAAIHPANGAVKIIASPRRARETVGRMVAAGVSVVPVRTCQEARELEAVGRREALIRSRWGGLLLVGLFGGFLASHYARFSPGERACCVSVLLIEVALALRSWWAWWRNEYPSGGRLVVRYWGRTGRGDDPAAALECEESWPPAPRRPGDAHPGERGR